MGATLTKNSKCIEQNEFHMRVNLGVFFTLLLAIPGCGMLAQSSTPIDAREILFTSVYISVSTKREEARVEGGYYSGGIYDPGYLVGNGYSWSDGTDSTVTIGVSTASIQTIVASIIKEFKDVETVYTYSEHFVGAPRNPSLGTYSTDYMGLTNHIPRISIRLSGVKDAYSRNLWFSVPIEEVDSKFWDRLQSALPKEERFLEFVSGLHIYWKNNA